MGAIATADISYESTRMLTPQKGLPFVHPYDQLKS